MELKFKAKIMDEAAIDRTLVRIAHEILEKNDGTDDLCLIGIRTRGVPLARRLAKNIEKIDGVQLPVGELDITLYRDDLSTVADAPVLNRTDIPFPIAGKTVVLVDDVIYTCRARSARRRDAARPSGAHPALFPDRPRPFGASDQGQLRRQEHPDLQERGRGRPPAGNGRREQCLHPRERIKNRLNFHGRKKSMSKSSIGTEPVYDARTLGKPRMFILGLQHMFAMFGATVLVPALSGLDVATTLLFAGIGTLLFHLLTKGKVPAFLGSSFAFIGGYNAVRTIGTNADGSAIYNNDLLAYACFGVAIAGLMYIILSTLFKIFGVKKVMRYFPPIVTGPIIIAIGLTLSSSAITNCRANWLVAVVAILIVIGFNMWGKGMAKIIPILLGVLGSYIFALIVDPAERASVAAAVSSAKWFGLPIFWKNSVFHLFAGPVDSGVLWSAVLTVVPLSLATMVEHIGDICAISSTCGKNFMVDPGFHRTLLGDGLATTLASLFGAPANTTYGENTGVLALSRVYDPRVIRIAACIAIVVSFCPKFAALVSAMPTATIGGVSLVLYGMISAVGVRNVVENKVDFTNTRNVIIAALILVLAIGITYSGSIQIGVVSLSGLAVSSIVGILLNAILPGKDYTFEQDDQGATSVDFKV